MSKLSTFPASQLNDMVTININVMQGDGVERTDTFGVDFTIISGRYATWNNSQGWFLILERRLHLF